jgi:hypothetical protein
LCLRSEEEFELFQRIDMERRREEAEAGSERKSRLIEESELPDFLTQVPHHIVTLTVMYFGSRAQVQVPHHTVTIAVLYTGSERKSRLIEESELSDFLTQVPHHTQSASPGSLRSPSYRTSSLR